MKKKTINLRVIRSATQTTLGTMKHLPVTHQSYHLLILIVMVQKHPVKVTKMLYQVKNKCLKIDIINSSEVAHIWESGTCV